MNNPEIQQRWKAAVEAHERRRRFLITGVVGVVLLGAGFVLRSGWLPDELPFSLPVAEAEVVSDVAVEADAAEAAPASPSRSPRRRSPARSARPQTQSQIDLTALPQPHSAVIGVPDAAPEQPSAERPPHLGKVVQLGVTSATPPKSIPAQLQNRDEIVRLVWDRYPAHLRHGRYGGTVVLSLLVDESGSVREAKIARRSGFDEINAAALEIARSMRFSPAQRLGVISSARVEIPLVFRP